MIDWLDFTIELQHPTIAQGRWMIIDETGEVLRESDTLRKVEGSHDSTMQVTSRASIDFYSEAMLALGLYKGRDNASESSAISFYGNPSKFLQGHNVIGIECLRALASGVVNEVFPKLGLSDAVFFEALAKIQNFDFWVTRVDITNMFEIGTDNDVNDYLYMMPLTVKARGDRCDYTKSTFYVGKHSTIWTAKFYNKYKELISLSHKHRLNPKFNETGLLEFSKGKLRAEITLRKKQLDRLGVTHASKLQPKINDLFNDFMGRMTMTNQQANIKQLNDLTPTLRNTYERWRMGDNAKSFLKRHTFYRHKNELLSLGIDISLPPIPESQRVAEIKPLNKTLAPKIVRLHDIPKDLMPFIV